MDHTEKKEELNCPIRSQLVTSLLLVLVGYYSDTVFQIITPFRSLAASILWKVFPTLEEGLDLHNLTFFTRFKFALFCRGKQTAVASGGFELLLSDFNPLGVMQRGSMFMAAFWRRSTNHISSGPGSSEFKDGWHGNYH